MYNQREIVLVPFPYSDLSATKKRPVLIVSNNDYNSTHEDVVVCVITSNKYTDEYSLPLVSEDLELGMLPESSIVKVHKLFTIHQSKILRKFSVVKLEYFQSVVACLHKLISPELKTVVR